MRCVAYSFACLCLLIQACAGLQEEPSFGAGNYAPEAMTYLRFSSKSPSKQLEEDYRFTAKLAGYSRADQAWQSNFGFVRDFPGGMPVADVISSIQADLQEDFVYRPGGFAWSNGQTEQEWSMGLSVGRDIDLYRASFGTIDSERNGQVAIRRVEWASSEMPAGRDLLGAE
jgi:hypothetical protein